MAELRPGMTAAEAQAALDADPDYREMMRRKNEEHAHRVLENRRAEAPVLNDLQRAGFPVESITELLHKAAPYPTAIPILVRWLPLVENGNVKAAIARLLSVPWAGPQVAPALIREFRAAPDWTETGLRFALGNALSIVADDAVYPDIRALVQDPRYGEARTRLPFALARMKNPEVTDVLRLLLHEPLMAPSAAQALAERGVVEAIAEIEVCLTHSDPWARNEIKKALRKLERKRGKVRGTSSEPPQQAARSTREDSGQT
jgi:hypothetical protein